MHVIFLSFLFVLFLVNYRKCTNSCHRVRESTSQFMSCCENSDFLFGLQDVFTPPVLSLRYKYKLQIPVWYDSFLKIRLFKFTVIGFSPLIFHNIFKRRIFLVFMYIQFCPCLSTISNHLIRFCWILLYDMQGKFCGHPNSLIF